MRLVDSHGHLNADRFDDDLDQVLDGARAAGVERILVPGWNVRSSGRALEVVASRPWLDAAVGIHPHDAAKVDEAGWAMIEAWARDDRVVAIGETGLDSDRMFSPWDAQLENLRRNLALALATGKPAILHCRSKVGRAGRAGRAGGGAAGRGVRRGAGPCRVRGPRRRPSCTASRGRSTMRGRCWRWAWRSRSAGSCSGAARRRRPTSCRWCRPSGCWSRPTAPFLSPPGAPRGRNAPEFVAITARWVAERRGVGERELGDGLVAAYDATFPRSLPR